VPEDCWVWCTGMMEPNHTHDKEQVIGYAFDGVD
jgi:hypothetical protein